MVHNLLNTQISRKSIHNVSDYSANKLTRITILIPITRGRGNHIIIMPLLFHKINYHQQVLISIFAFYIYTV